MPENHKGRDLRVRVENFVEGFIQLVRLSVRVQSVEAIVKACETDDIQGCFAEPFEDINRTVAS